jgi:hypothetical protein
MQAAVQFFRCFWITLERAGLNYKETVSLASSITNRQ